MASQNDDLGVGNPFEVVSGPVATTAEQALLNPWFSMMSDPRTTVRQLFDQPQLGRIILLAVLSGIATLIIYVGLPVAPLDEDIQLRFVMLAISIAVGAVFGLIRVALLGWLSSVIGRSLGGTGTSRECCTAIAWSNVPTVWLLPLFVAASIYAAMIGPEILVVLGDTEHVAYVPWVKTTIGVATVVFVWQVYLVSQALGEAHRFRSLKGFATVVLAGLALSVVMIAATLALEFLFYSMSLDQ